MLNLADGNLAHDWRYPAPSEEEEQLSALGLRSKRFPLSLAGLNLDKLCRLCHELSIAPKPMLIHGRVGREAIVLALMHIVVESSGAENPVLRQGIDLDEEYDDPRLPAYVHQYVEQLSRPLPTFSFLPLSH